MKSADIHHHRLKWRQALRIATQSPDRWIRKAAQWNLGLLMSTETQRRAERPTKRWEDDLIDFVTDEETDATQRNDLENSPLRRTSTNGNRKKDNAPNTLSTLREPDPSLTRWFLRMMTRRPSTIQTTTVSLTSQKPHTRTLDGSVFLQYVRPLFRRFLEVTLLFRKKAKKA